MPSDTRRAARRPFALAALAALAFCLCVPPLAAQPLGLDFAAPAGEDTLLGQGSHDSAKRYGHHDRRGGYGDRRVQRPFPSVTRHSPRPRSTYFRGTGVFANAQGSPGSILYLAPRDAAQAAEPRIIDVEAQRLDRLPVGPGGISVVHVGTAKIIRLSPGYERHASAAAAEKDMAALPAPAPVERPAPTPRPEPAPAAPTETPAEPAPSQAPAPTPAQAAGQPFLEPWTEEWLADCVARHEDFDAALGTYLGEDGLRRFCTGEPA